LRTAFCYLALATTALEGACAGIAPRSPARGSWIGEPLPNLTLKSFEGNGSIRLDTRGRVVLLDIWASWCAPCKEELPLLDNMAARLAPAGVEIIAISIDEEKARAVGFTRGRPKWTLTLAHDPEGRVPALLQPPRMPTSYLIDRKGIIRHVNVGFDRGDIAKIEARLIGLAAER
jgi:thiol-disulfide isomerase/thioredoxin